MSPQNDAFLSAVLNALPSPVFIVDDDVRVITANRAAQPLLGQDAITIYLRKGGEALHCLHATDDPGGCGQGPNCGTCVVRASVAASFHEGTVVRRATKMVLEHADGRHEVYMLVATSPLVYEGKRYVILTLENISELVELRRLIPICASCKKIRNESKYWASIEDYFKHHLDLDFTHGICPECMRRLYPETAAEFDKE